jgi:hypothetical protein
MSESGGRLKLDLEFRSISEDGYNFGLVWSLGMGHPRSSFHSPSSSHVVGNTTITIAIDYFSPLSSILIPKHNRPRTQKSHLALTSPTLKSSRLSGQTSKTSNPTVSRSPSVDIPSPPPYSSAKTVPQQFSTD